MKILPLFVSQNPCALRSEILCNLLFEAMKNIITWLKVWYAADLAGRKCLSEVTINIRVVLTLSIKFQGKVRSVTVGSCFTVRDISAWHIACGIGRAAHDSTRYMSREGRETMKMFVVSRLQCYVMHVAPNQFLCISQNSQPGKGVQ